MNINDIIDIVTGLDEPTKQLVVRDLRPELSSALSAVSSHPLDTLQPAPRDIMNAFKLCPVGNIKVVLIGQDPYRKHAQGLSFSVPRTEKVPPSLQNIYKCLKHNGLIDEIPTHGDLTNWAVQGVLLLNTMLTVGETSHREWIPYTNKLIEKLSKQSTHIVFILLGKHAAKLKDLIGSNHDVLEWGHPSPLNAANRTLNPTNFIHCDVFTRANDALIWNNKTPINWNPDECVYSASAIQDLKSDTLTDNLPFSPNNTLYIFTDGGSIDNGKPGCIASWGYYICDLKTRVGQHGIVEGEGSNNKGELTAILRGVQYIYNNLAKFKFDNICLVSDSEYSIKASDIWIHAWLKDKKKLEGKKNLDLIIAIKDTVRDLRKHSEFKFQHIRSHRKEPTDDTWFLWKGNDIVDKYCNLALGRRNKV